MFRLDGFGFALAWRGAGPSGGLIGWVMALPTITVDDVMAWNPCAVYSRAVLVEFFGEGEFTAFDILAKSGPMQDRLFSIMREATIGAAGLAAVDAWVSETFAGITPSTVEGQNCVNQWPRPDEFQRAVFLAALLRAETGSDEQFTAGLSSILGGL